VTGFDLLHADARAVLDAWTPPDPAQAILAQEYLAHLRSYPLAMSRDNAPGHLTGSALVVDEDRTRTLLTLHPRVGRWLQLGGHCEPADLSLRGTALREAREESGIDGVTISDEPLRLDRHALTCSGGPTVHWDVQYLAVVGRDARESISAESDDLRWFPLDALAAGVDDSVRALVDAVLAPDGTSG